MSYTTDVLEEYIKELEAQIKALTKQIDLLLVKADKWDRLVAEDPDASIILGDELMEACEELDELRTKLEAIRTIAEDKETPAPMSFWKIQYLFQTNFNKVLGDE